MTRTDQDEYVTLNVEGGAEMRAFVARPAGPGPHPGIIVFQEALGVNAQLRGVGERYAGLGFLVIMPDLFHRVSPGFTAEKIDMEQLMPLLKTLTNDGIAADARAAYDWLASQPDVDTARIAAMGFCMGGRATYIANSMLPLAAAISYYGGGIAPSLLDRAPTLHGPHAFYWAGNDTNIPTEQHRAVIDAVRDAGKTFVDVEFSGANHGYFNERTDRYDEAAALQSWAIGSAFLAQYCVLSKSS